MHSLEEIGASASKEYSLEKAMEKMKIEWADVHFEFIPYRDTVSLTSTRIVLTRKLSLEKIEFAVASNLPTKRIYGKKAKNS